MKSIALAVSVAILAIGVGCQTPNQTNSVPLQKVQNDLPPDWITLKDSDARMAYLDPATRQALFNFRKSLIAEQKTPAYESAGGYSNATYARMKQVNEQCSNSYCANAVVIGRDLSPELAGEGLSVNEAYMNSAVVGDVDLREAQDDWARFWLMNKPSSLSPYPIVNTGGRP
ncbi:MAG: hypothetical protein EXS03_09230 [Phycisphaerales bacterium]|nr:hypothetical protein [Phycisphaerales bacterium]